MELERRGGDMELLAAAGTARPSEALASITTRVVRTYAVAAAAWIVASDLVVAAATGDDLPVAGIAKGLLFVAVTSTVLWVVLRRLTDRFDRMSTRTITAQRDFYGSILATSSDIVAIFGADGRTVYVNDAVTERLGWLPGQLVGRPGREIVHPADRTAAVSFREGVGFGASGDEQRTFLLRHHDGSFRAMEVRGAPIQLVGGERGVVINARDVTDRARSERQLRAALAEDVTGLPGLRMFMAEMEGLEELRPDGLRATVALVDVDRFGDVNQLHGREGGDEVLRELARRLEAALPEALGVWRHGADEFVLVVLDDGHDRAAEPHVLGERVRTLAAAPVLLAEDGARAAVDVSVGVARLDLADQDADEPLGTVLLRAAEGALHDAKRHPDRIAVRRSGSARSVLDELRRTGIGIAIDDFGTGYSTLEHIRVFEVDELKIDKGFVERLGRSAADEAIVDSVLAIAQRLGLRVTAEGIEHAAALDYLRERGCTMGQGYLFSRPRPGDEFDPRASYRGTS